MRRSPTSTTRTGRGLTRTLSTPLVLGWVVALWIASLVLPSPFAGGQGDAAFAKYEQVPRGTACPAGTSAVGDVTFDGIVGGEPYAIDATFCQPFGFVPVTDQTQCDLASTVLPGDLIVYFPQMPLCASDGVPLPAELSCGPLPRAFGPGFYQGEEIGFGGCLVPLLVPGAAQSVGSGSAGVPVCIESELVQRSSTAAGLSVGGTFHEGGVRYLIATGAPTCQFHCADGFDTNCDGKLGDYCPTGLDLRTVRDVGLCLASLAPAPQSGVARVASVPANSATNVFAVQLPIAPAGPQIAHTGAESAMLAYVGTSLIAFGSFVLGIRRRLA